MKSIKKYSILFFIFLNLLTNNLWPASKGGSTSGNFLLLGVGSRTISLGQSVSALNNDIFNIYYNPAFISYQKALSMGFMHSSYFENVNHNYLTFKKKNYAISLNYINYGKIDRTVYSTEVVPAGNFSAHDICLMYSYATSFTEFDKLGFNIKYINSKLDNVSADAIALDLGFHYIIEYFYYDDLHLGFSINNVGTKLKYISKSENLPLQYRLGLSYKIFPNINFSFDIVKRQYDDLGIQSGVEWKINKILYLRSGYNSLNEASKKISLGFGVGVSNWNFNYAYMPYNDLDSLHSISLDYNFNKSTEKAKQHKPQENIYKFEESEHPIIDKETQLKNSDQNKKHILFCHNCGENLTEHLQNIEIKYCPFCGTKVK